MFQFESHVDVDIQFLLGSWYKQKALLLDCIFVKEENRARGDRSDNQMPPGIVATEVVNQPVSSFHGPFEQTVRKFYGVVHEVAGCFPQRFSDGP